MDYHSTPPLLGHNATSNQFSSIDAHWCIESLSPDIILLEPCITRHSTTPIEPGLQSVAELTS